MLGVAFEASSGRYLSVFALENSGATFSDGLLTLVDSNQIFKFSREPDDVIVGVYFQVVGTRQCSSALTLRHMPSSSATGVYFAEVAPEISAHASMRQQCRRHVPVATILPVCHVPNRSQ